VETGHLVAHRVKQVGLPETDPPVEEEGAIGRPGQLRDRLAGRLGKLVGAADHEGLERVARRQVVEGGPGDALARERGRGLGLRVHLDRDLRVGAEHGAGGGLDRVHVVLPDPVARELVGREDPQTVAVRREKPAGAQPRFQGGVGDLTFEGGEQARPQGFKHI